MIKTIGVHHIVLKVADVKKSSEFYQKACGMEVFMEEHGAVGLTGCGLDSLWLVAPENGEDAAKFNRRGDIGLDHWSFGVEGLENLKKIEAHLKKQGIEMEDGGITDNGYGGTAIFCQDPDGMILEFSLLGEK